MELQVCTLCSGSRKKTVFSSILTWRRVQLAPAIGSRSTLIRDLLVCEGVALDVDLVRLA